MSKAKTALLGLIDHFAAKISQVGKTVAENMAESIAEDLAKKAAKAAKRFDSELDAMVTPTRPRKIRRGK